MNARCSSCRRPFRYVVEVAVPGHVGTQPVTIDVRRRPHAERGLIVDQECDDCASQIHELPVEEVARWRRARILQAAKRRSGASRDALASAPRASGLPK